MVWKHEETGEYDCRMTLILCSFLGTGVECGQKSERRKVDLKTAIDDIPRTTQT